MPTRFLHCADIHLGYQQYNEKERFNDFGRALLAVIDSAIAEQVNFVLLAGDLFHKRSIDALTLNQAVYALRKLRAANIPCIAVEGNHERAYHEEVIGWMKFLALQDLLILLDAEFKEGKPQLLPWEPARRQGAYIDLPGNVRVYGLRYYGSGTVAAVEAYANAMAELPRIEDQFTIFMAHAGVEGQLDDKAGGLSLRQWAPLRPHADYVALGHFHKPFQIENWIYNPGSPENCSIAEADWNHRGYLVVDLASPAPDAETPRHSAVLKSNPRRACALYTFKTDHVTAPDALLAQLRMFLQRKSVELADEIVHSRGNLKSPPVVELYLTGVLPFERAALDLGAIEHLLGECFEPSPLVVMVKNLTRTADFAVDAETNLTRSELERQVLAGLFARDVRFAAHSDAWAATAIEIKQLALADTPATAIIDELAAQLEKMHNADTAS